MNMDFFFFYISTILFVNITAWLATHKHINDVARRYIWELVATSFFSIQVIYILSCTPSYLDVGKHLGNYNIGDDSVLEKFAQLQCAWYFVESIREIESLPRGRYIMFFHHVLSCYLFKMAYYNKLVPLSLAMTAVSTFSNPLLSLAKLAHHYKHPISHVANIAFTLVFFTTRIIAFPLIVLRPLLNSTLDTAGVRISQQGGAVLYGMQLVWFYQILGKITQKTKVH